MNLKKTMLTSVIAITALFGVVSPANASTGSQAPSHAVVAPVAHVAANPAVAAVLAEQNRRAAATHGVDEVGGTIAEVAISHFAQDAGGQLTDSDATHEVADCGAAICDGVGSNYDPATVNFDPDSIGGSTGEFHEAR